MSVPTDIAARAAAEDRAISLLGGLYRYRATGDETANAYSLFEVSGPFGFASPFHVHDHETEGFYVVEGTVLLFLDGREVRAGIGSFALVPPNVPHTFRFESDQARLLLLVSPGNAGHEALFREMGRPAGDAASPPTEPPDFAQLGAIAARHGTRIVGPPPGAKD
jgi:quercetin dioxygenase-like cupin family protein